MDINGLDMLIDNLRALNYCTVKTNSAQLSCLKTEIERADKLLASMLELSIIGLAG